MPATTATAPPMISHMDLSVGLPVNVRETSELKECEALKPKINSTTPRASIAKPVILFMVFPFCLILARLFLWANREFPYSLVQNLTNCRQDADSTLCFRGQQNGKRSAFACMAFHLNCSVMFFDDSPSDGETEAGAVLFGGKERLE